MADVEASAIGKLQSTGNVIATVERPSQDVDALKKRLLKEAQDLWTERVTRWNSLAYDDANTLESTQRWAFGRQQGRLLPTEYRQRFMDTQEKYKGEERRKRCNALADEYYAQVISEIHEALNNFASDSQTIFDFDHPAFQAQAKQIIRDYVVSIKDMWKAEITTMGRVFDQRYAKAESWQAWHEIAQLSYDVSSRGNALIDKGQRDALDKMRKALKAAWDATFYASRIGAIEKSMEEVQQENRSSDVYLRNDGAVITQRLTVPTVTTLRPFDVVTVEVDDAPLLHGYPRMPKLWARCTPVLSSNGTVVADSRMRPDEVSLTSRCRWVAGEDYWVGGTGSWKPLVNDLGYRITSTNLAAQPLLVNSAKVVGSEVIRREALRIADGATLTCDFGNDAMGTFTMSMVLSPNPSAASYPLLDMRGDYEVGQRFAWWIDERLDYYYGDMGGSVDPMTTLPKMRPMIVTSVVSNNICTTYVGYSPRHLFTTSIKAKIPGAQPMKFSIGNADSDFSIYEFNLWTTPLSGDEVVSLHSNYYSIYGTTDDWR